MGAAGASAAGLYVPQVPDTRRGFGVYVHWPFCKKKCPYCDFNSHVRDFVDHPRWAAALVREIAHYAALTPGREVTSIFFGGGTPSLMAPETVAAVIEAIGTRWGLARDAEITLEANPTSVEADKFAAFARAGVNRVSLGVQSLRDDDLAFLGREHSVSEAVRALAIARDHFRRWSFDLIYARPGQSVAMWQDELGEALAMGAHHLSLYQLTIEQGTQFFTLHQRGDLHVPDEALAADLYEATQDLMTGAGKPAYEISNHAAPGEESRHNLTYWRYGDYVGIGPGAHGRLTVGGGKQATRTHRAPEIWLERAETHGTGAHPPEAVDAAARVQEMLMMGLRLVEGVPEGRLVAETGEGFARWLDQQALARMVAGGFIRADGDTIAATDAGRQRLGAVTSAILG